MGIGAMTSIPLFSLSIIFDSESAIHIILLGIIFMIIGIFVVWKLYKSQLPIKPKVVLPIKYHRKPYEGSNPIGVVYPTKHEMPVIVIEEPSVFSYNEFSW